MTKVTFWIYNGGKPSSVSQARQTPHPVTEVRKVQRVSSAPHSLSETASPQLRIYYEMQDVAAITSIELSS